MTLTRTSDKYVVHELLTAEDIITPCDLPTSVSLSNSNISEPTVMHSSEVAGLDIRPSPEDGLWRAVAYGKGTMSEIVVDVGPVHHRGRSHCIRLVLACMREAISLSDPCLGYVFTEVKYPSRKLVLLGDTHDPSPMIPLCLNPSPALLVHEATDSHISKEADPSGKLSRRSADEVLKKALARGHSVPDMAGAFAKKIDAQQLVLNHIGARYAPLHHFSIVFHADPPNHLCCLDSQHHVTQLILHAIRSFVTLRRKQVKLGAQGRVR